MHATSGRSEFNDLSPSTSQESRQQVICSHCEKQIVGTRYRCTICANFDLCSSCKSSTIDFASSNRDSNMMTHKDSHAYFKIDDKINNVDNYTTIMNRSHMVHVGERCNECEGPIVGFKYQCIQCQHDMCEECESNGLHDWTHTRLKTVPKSLI
jgi:hypothetical protein